MSHPISIEGHFLRTFGAAALIKGSEIVPLRRKDLALLVYFALEQDRVHSRSALASRLWGESTEREARHSLTQAVSRLRNWLGDSVIEAGRDTVIWRGVLPCDASRLEEIGKTRATPEEALSLYVGDFLQGFSAGEGARGFDDWTEGKRLKYREIAVSILERIGVEAEREERWEDLLRLSARLVELDLYRESGHRWIMLALYRKGERMRALAHYDAYATRLDEEVGLPPHEDTQALARSIREAMVSGDSPASPLTSRAPGAGRDVPLTGITEVTSADESARAVGPPVGDVQAHAEFSVALKANRDPPPTRKRLHRWILGAVSAGGVLLVVFLWWGNGDTRGSVVQPLGANSSAQPRSNRDTPGCPGGPPVAQFISESFRDNAPVRPDEPFLKTWTVRNTGRCTWGESYTLRYMTSSGPRLSRPPNRVPVRGQVPPGALYTFAVPMQAPHLPGTYREDWQLRDGESGTIPVSSSATIWAKIWVPPAVVPVCTVGEVVAKFVGESHPDSSVVPPGQAFTKIWTIRNIGPCTWDRRFSLVYVASRPTRLSAGSSAITLAQEVPPGGTYTFQVPMRAPRSAGEYREDWSFLDANGETVHFGESKTLWTEITVP